MLAFHPAGNFRRRPAPQRTARFHYNAPHANERHRHLAPHANERLHRSASTRTTERHRLSDRHRFMARRPAISRRHAPPARLFVHNKRSAGGRMLSWPLRRRVLRSQLPRALRRTWKRLYSFLFLI